MKAKFTLVLIIILGLLANGNVFSQTIQLSKGVAFLDRDVNVINDTVTTTVCFGDTFLYNGHAYDTTGIYTDTLTGVNGPDTIVTTQLTISPLIVTTTYDTICHGQFYLFNGQALSASGIYKDTLAAGSGCDSIIELHFTLNPVPTPTITQNDNALNTQVFTTYQWKEDNTNISLATTQNYTATASGSYTVLVGDAHGCTATSPSVNVTIAGIGSVELENITLAPNPTTGNLNFMNLDNKSYQVEVTNVAGQKMSAQPLTGGNINISNLASGIYQVVITSGELQKGFKVVKE